ncbi:MAG TPA: sulfotransferase [Myxococcota bacterium]|nr:sulfotransferase [Myxococcota bacterium]
MRAPARAAMLRAHVWEPLTRLSERASAAVWRLAEKRILAAPSRGLEGRRPVFVLFTPRAGSKHFLSLLASIPGAAFDFEILGRSIQWRVPETYFQVGRGLVERLIALRARQTQLGPHFLRPSHGHPIFTSKAVCLTYVRNCLEALHSEICAVKFQYEQLQCGGITPVDLHQAFPHARFVILYRRSLSRQLVSDVMRHVTREGGNPARRPSPEPTETVRLSPAKVRSYYAAVRAIYAEWMELPLLAQHGVVVCYEDLCEDPQSVFERSVFPMLGVAPAAVENRRFVKQTRRKLSEIVENYDEVADLLEGPESIQDYARATQAT